MPLSYNEVRREYLDFKTQFPDDPTDLTSFAKQMDALKGTQDRSEAYTDGMFKQANAAIDRGFEATRLPEAGAWAGRGFGRLVDDTLGTHVGPVLEQVGRDTPRMITEGLATIPLAGSGAGAPAAGAMWANRLRKFHQLASPYLKTAGYGSAFARGTAETDNPLGGAVAAGSLGLGNYIIPEAMGAAKTGLSKFFDRGTRELSEEALKNFPENVVPTSLTSRILTPFGEVGAGVGAATALNEATRQATLGMLPDEKRAPGDRNPFTQENVAGNVAGAAFFLPQLVTGLRNPQRLSPKHVKQLDAMIKKQANVLKERAEYARLQAAMSAMGHDKMGTPEYNKLWQAVEDIKNRNPESVGMPPGEIAAEGVPSLEGTGRADALMQMFATDSEALKIARRDGNQEVVERIQRRLEDTYDEIVTGKAAPISVEQQERLKTLVDEQIKMQPPETPQQFQDLARDVFGYLDFLNEGKLKYQNELKLREDQLNHFDSKAVAAHEAWKNEQLRRMSQEAGREQTGHLGARSPDVVKQLWSVKDADGKPVIPPLSKEWLESEWQVKFDDSGNPQFAKDVLSQKIANFYADSLDAAVEKARALRKADTSQDVGKTTKRTRAADELETQYINALTQIPTEFQRNVWNRDIAIRRTGERVDPRKGAEVSQLPQWQRAVVRAVESYDPASQTILLNTKPKKYERVPITRLFEKSGDRYAWSPAESHVSVYRGGKRAFEGNLEELASKNESGRFDIEDEEAFKRALAEQQSGEGLLGTTRDPSQGIVLDEAARLNEGPQIAEETATPVVDSPERTKKILTNLDSLTDEQLWFLASPEFSLKMQSAVDAKRSGLRDALKVALAEVKTGKDTPLSEEGKRFLTRFREKGNVVVGDDRKSIQVILRDFFQNKVPVEGGGTKQAYFEQRLGRVVKRLLDDKLVERAKKGMVTRAQKDAPLVQFSGPIRLQRWFRGEYKLGVKPNSVGQVRSQSVEGLLYKLGLTADEMQLYKAAGLDGMLKNEYVGVNDLTKWMESVTPKVEVKKLKPFRETDESSRIQHELETLGFSIEADEMSDKPILQYNRRGNPPPELKARADKLLKRFSRASNATSDAATGRYGVEPKELKDMPDAVDILVRVPMKAKDAPSFKSSGSLARENPEMDYTAFRGPHFGESDRNVLASVRGYVETLPSGEKVFHVFEVQSDWGQRTAKRLENGKALGKLHVKQNEDGSGDWAVYNERNEIVEDRFNSPEGAQHYIDKSQKDVGGHPLLAVYEQLALKAAIDHARELGIRKVAISDAETAMMTEGHDRYAHADDDIRMDPNIPAHLKVPKIAQEPGMRAAYDDRLPRTMEKLTGRKGEVVDFGRNKDAKVVGSPVFKDARGNAKELITARLYDISSAPDQFAAFGYGKPQVGAEGTSSGRDFVVNPPREGQFTADVERTIRSVVDKELGRRGYSGTTREFLTQVATALSRQFDTSSIDFYRISGSEYGLAGRPTNADRASIGLNVDRPVVDETRFFTNLLQTLSHEISHMDGYIRAGLIPKPDAYSGERKRVYDHMFSLAETLSPEERATMLEAVKEYLPESMRSKTADADGRPYGTSDPEEFVSEITGHVTNMLAWDTPQGRAAAKEFIDMAPTEVRDFARNTFGTIKDVLEAMEKTVQTDNFVLKSGFGTLLDAARAMTDFRHTDQALAEARLFSSNASGAPVPGPTSSIWFRTGDLSAKAQKAVGDGPTPTVVEAVQEASKFMGKRAYDRSVRPDVVQRLLFPLRNMLWAQERRGNIIARPIADTIFQLEAGAHRIAVDLLSPFIKKNADGSSTYDRDNPLVRKIQEERTGPWRDALNKVRAWQQESQKLMDNTRREAQSMFVTNEKGQVVVNPQLPEAQATWDRISSRLSREDAGLVMSQSVAIDGMGQRSAKVLYAAIAESNANRGAALLMAMNRGMGAEQAFDIANSIHTALLNGQVPSLAGTGLAPHVAEALGNLYQELLGNLKQVQDHYSQRPGYSSEALPHDWIIRYKDQNGKTKFDSRPHESQALARAEELRAAGNVIDGEIVHRKDLREYSPYDDPDGILAKSAEKENFVWSKTLQDVEKKFGVEVANAMREAYTPMEISLREQSAAGIKKFMKERKSFVDRGQFDYLDAGLAAAQRLAYTVAVRSMTQRKNLLLNDPSIRFDTTFKNMINEHVNEMLRPQSEYGKQLKALTTGYFMVGNLSSAVFNATQSATTLVPVLDSMNPGGNFVKPWIQTGRAVKDAIDYTISGDWKQDAAATRGVDPKKWTEEQTVAELWRRQVEAGGFSNTVIDDLVYGTDQKLLTSARFGRGDYGPVTKGQMMSSGLYMMNQLGMKPFRWVEHLNAKTAFLAGARQAYEQGLRGDAAFSHATTVQGLATFGGGRANQTGLQTKLSKALGPSGAGIALALQQYGFGVVSLHAQMAKDAIMGSPTMTSAEKLRAKRVYGTMLMTQTAMAGALGLPLVGATLTILEKTFGIPANQAVREGLASLSTDDEGNPDDTGRMLADVGMNGFLDYWLGKTQYGMDVSSRLGTSSLLGTSAYRGFSWEDLFGPAGSILTNAYKGLQYASQGNLPMAAHSIVPVALKNSILLSDTKSKYGDYGFRDVGGNLLYQPTDEEAALFRFGFRPSGLSRRRQMSQLLQASNERASAEFGRSVDEAASSLVQGNAEDALRLAGNVRDQFPGADSVAVLRQVMEQAVNAEKEKDLLASGSQWNSRERMGIARTFPTEVNPRRSEVEMMQLRMQMAQMLGDPRLIPSRQAMQQAVLMDAMQEQDVPRTQASQGLQAMFRPGR